MKTLSGLDAIISQGFEPIGKRAVSLVCNQATVASDLRHALEHFMNAQKDGLLRIQSVLGPQHGLWGHTQDNMIEWEGAGDPRFPFPIYSLYGTHREPTDVMLEGAEMVVVDLPDIGSRYYTFIWTTALCMKQCEALGIPIFILDRPNPLGGIQVEGTVLEPEYASFVGLYPLPTRHGMTLGEIARYLKERFFPDVDLRIARCEHWHRNQPYEHTRMPWVMPSPNMPTLDTAFVYPGGCLLEGTALSEGRGTTHPFEIFGAPYIDAWEFCGALNGLGMEGVYFRPLQFEPTFQKHAQTICEGAFVHVTDRLAFRSFLAYVAIIRETLRLYPSEFEWKAPPYEYEYEKLPIDILAGNSWLRKAIEDLEPLEQIEEKCIEEQKGFAATRKTAFLYES